MDPAPSKLRLAFRHYLLGFLSAAWNGGIGALATILGVDTVSITGISQEVRILNGHEMISAFVGGMLLAGVMWLKNHPLPENWSTVAPWTNPTPTPPPSQ